LVMQLYSLVVTDDFFVISYSDGSPLAHS
jgi:hypothetical protein